MDPDILRGLRGLADLRRVRILGRLASEPAVIETLAGELRLSAPQVRHHLEALEQSGLVMVSDAEPGRFSVRPDRLAALAKALARLDRDHERGAEGPGSGSRLSGAWPHDGEPLADTLARLALTPEEARTLRAFVVDGRLVSIPVQAKKRQVVLRFLLERTFTEDREYPEKEVNQRLALFHPDVAALRRFLVDDRYVDREGGRYRRLPGSPTSAPSAPPRRAGAEPV